MSMGYDAEMAENTGAAKTEQEDSRRMMETRTKKLTTIVGSETRRDSSAD